ncbi:SpoVR family protein [Desulfitobacterium sp.]|uniref:SpoVR family protein n=1 Tax=Desulfitobacterium sp. TaxID=49981 RepID=UPI002BA2D4D7|nr:SpoVR family protein [Desulfitobacterium sp.]HVJ50339.1 SpoVR family protein [Desulfitobacterium sp.]
MDREIRELGIYAQEIASVARNLGLDFYPVHFEVCPAEALYTLGAYGMPVRFAHWSFGKAFYRLKMQYDLNLSRIYELVINSDPAYAFLLEGNSLIQNKLVMGHVYAHVDFFKNNHYFQRTPRDMVERMAAHAEQIRKYELIYGREKVEQVLDAVLSIQEHVDSCAYLASREGKGKTLSSLKKPSSPYEDLWEEGPQEDLHEKQEQEDLLLFIMENSSVLEEWERDIVSMIREESLYFFPQIETKIINEGWATFWHSRIMHELDLTDEEVVDFAVMHSQVVQPSRLALNPYYLGVKIWESLAEKNDMGYLFEVRETENDISFIRNHLDRELVEKLNLFNFRKVGAHWQVTDTAWEKVRNTLVQNLVNGGNPKIVVVDGDYEGKRVLYLRHAHEGLDLDLVYLEKTLLLVQKLWGKTANLETVIDGKKVLFECQNGSVSRKHLSRQLEV